jgi:hypothetical protein
MSPNYVSEQFLNDFFGPLPSKYGILHHSLFKLGKKIGELSKKEKEIDDGMNNAIVNKDRELYYKLRFKKHDVSKEKQEVKNQYSGVMDELIKSKQPATQEQ